MAGLGRVVGRREEGAVAGPAAGGWNPDDVDEVPGVVGGVDEEDGVGAQVGDGEVAACRVEDGLVGAGGVLPVVGAEFLFGLDLLDQFGGAVGDVPDVNLALRAGEDVSQMNDGCKVRCLEISV